MKKITLLAICLMSIIAISAKAQLTIETDSYQRFEASFVAQNFDWENNTEINLKGFGLGYVNATNLTTKLPLFLELGGQLTWAHINDAEGFSEEHNFTFMSIALPLDFAYKFSFVNSETITISPFIGPNFKFNLISKERGRILGNEFDRSHLNKDHMGGRSNAASRFQAGLNIGVGFNINKLLYLGYKFQPDFKDYMKGDVKANTNYITIGYNF